MFAAPQKQQSLVLAAMHMAVIAIQPFQTLMLPAASTITPSLVLLFSYILGFAAGIYFCVSALRSADRQWQWVFFWLALTARGGIFIVQQLTDYRPMWFGVINFVAAITMAVALIIDAFRNVKV